MIHLETIKRVRELDKERTQGEWIAGCHPALHAFSIVKPIMFGNRVGKMPECEGSSAYFLHAPDGEFIAQAPAMAATIEHLLSVVKAQHDALEGVTRLAVRAFCDSKPEIYEACSVIELSAPYAELVGS